MTIAKHRWCRAKSTLDGSSLLVVAGRGRRAKAPAKATERAGYPWVSPNLKIAVQRVSVRREMRLGAKSGQIRRCGLPFQ